MEESFSESVFSRLPSAIRGLDLTHQKVFIHMRLGKRETDISRLLGLDEDNTRLKIIKVREALAQAGLLDLIEEPRFVSIHSSSEDEPEFQLRSFELPIEKRLILNEFLSILRDAIESLPHHQSQILRLRYRQDMTAKDILSFSKKISTSLVPGKNISELGEQDIFYALNTALKEVLKKVKVRYCESSVMCTDSLKYILEEVEF